MSNEKDIITDYEKLSDWCVEIDVKKEGKLCQEIVLALKATMRKNNLETLTAPQIGYNRRVMCMKFGKSDYRTFINPMTENNSNITMSRETCSSIPDTRYIIPRFNKVKFFYTTPMGDVQGCNLVGRAAHLYQHCLDHLNGMIVSDVGLQIDDDFDNATEEEKQEILRMYMESLDLRQKELNKMIEEDKELSDLNDAIKFIRSVKDGETTLEKVDKKEPT